MHFSASVMHDWDPYGFQLSYTDICIFTQMGTSCKHNSDCFSVRQFCFMQSSISWFKTIFVKYKSFESKPHCSQFLKNLIIEKKKKKKKEKWMWGMRDFIIEKILGNHSKTKDILVFLRWLCLFVYFPQQSHTERRKQKAL